MAFLPNPSISLTDVSLLAAAADAAYAGQPLPAGWNVITPALLGLAPIYQDGNYFRDASGTGSAIVLQNQNSYVLAFRGTDSLPADLPTYPGLLLSASNPFSYIHLF